LSRYLLPFIDLLIEKKFMKKEDLFVNHKEQDFTLSLPSALLFEFKTEKDARRFNDAVWTLLFHRGGDVRSSLVSMEASEIYTKPLV
tara:strand:- start:124 stop:384 length:261 start_codon:yes stop_codon:yes gene_type:complete